MCNNNAPCTNTKCSYESSCKAGFTENGANCCDIDECSRVPIHETKMLLVKIILVHMYVNALMVTVFNAKMSTNANCHPVMKMRHARILLEVTIVSAMMVSMMTDFRVLKSTSAPF